MTLFIIIRIIYEAYFRFPHFKILKAGMRKWIQRTSGELISYQIELKTKKSSLELVFEELWIDEKKYKFHLTRQDRKIAGSFVKREVLKLNIISEIKNNLTSENPVVSSKGILVLWYSFKNKKKHLRIKKFQDIDNIKLCGSN